MNQHPLLAGHRAIKRECSRTLRAECTPAEQRLWRELRGNRLAGLHFRRQQVLYGLIADFYCHKARVAIELDGAVHLRQQEYDRERDLILHTHRIATIRFPNASVESDLPRVLNEIRTLCLERMADGGSCPAR